MVSNAIKLNFYSFYDWTIFQEVVKRAMDLDGEISLGFESNAVIQNPQSSIDLVFSFFLFFFILFWEINHHKGNKIQEDREPGPLDWAIYIS